MKDDTREAVLMIADISGYTKFMIANQTALGHGQFVITELMKTVLKEAKLPLMISKLEGDAVFLFLETSDEKQGKTAKTEYLLTKMNRMVSLFHSKIAELIASNLCPCGACRHIDQLRLKIIVHRGQALFYRIDRFTELSGSDVILVHRLLKNSLMQEEYILLSEAAFKEFALPPGTIVTEGEESYENFPTIKTYSYAPKRVDVSNEKAKTPSGIVCWIGHQLKLWSVRLKAWGWVKQPKYSNIQIQPEKV